MILLISSTESAVQCMTAVEEATGERVRIVPDLRSATELLRGGDFSAIVIDQLVIDSNPGAADLLWTHAGTGIHVIINFALAGLDRIVREIRSALHRREQEHLIAVRAAMTALRNEFKGALTGILLSSELALAQSSLPPTIASKLESVHELALQMSERLTRAA